MINISLNCIPKGPVNNIPALVQIMARRQQGNKPLSEAILVSLLTHICITRPQWIKHKAWASLQWHHICIKVIRITGNFTVCSMFVHSYIKGNIKAPYNWPFVMGIYWRLVDSPHKAPIMPKNYFHAITSSCGQNILSFNRIWIFSI